MTNKKKAPQREAVSLQRILHYPEYHTRQVWEPVMRELKKDNFTHILGRARFEGLSQRNAKVGCLRFVIAHNLGNSADERQRLANGILDQAEEIYEDLFDKFDWAKPRGL